MITIFLRFTIGFYSFYEHANDRTSVKPFRSTAKCFQIVFTLTVWMPHYLHYLSTELDTF